MKYFMVHVGSLQNSCFWLHFWFLRMFGTLYFVVGTRFHRAERWCSVVAFSSYTQCFIVGVTSKWYAPRAYIFRPEACKIFNQFFLSPSFWAVIGLMVRWPRSGPCDDIHGFAATAEGLPTEFAAPNLACIRGRMHQRYFVKKLHFTPVWCAHYHRCTDQLFHKHTKSLTLCRCTLSICGVIWA